MRFRNYLYIVTPIFIAFAAIYFLFVASLNSDGTTWEQKSTMSTKAQKKKCRCCDRLKRFEKEFAARKAQGEFDNLTETKDPE